MCVVFVVLVTWFHPGNNSVYLSTLNALHCNMSYIGLFGFLALLGGTIKLSAENTQDGTETEKEI